MRGSSHNELLTIGVTKVKTLQRARSSKNVAWTRVDRSAVRDGIEQCLLEDNLDPVATTLGFGVVIPSTAERSIHLTFKSVFSKGPRECIHPRLD